MIPRLFNAIFNFSRVYKILNMFSMNGSLKVIMVSRFCKCPINDCHKSKYVAIVAAS